MTPAPAARERVLVIDDDPVARYLAGATLHADFDVAEAANVRDGLDRLATEPFDLLLLDMHLPDGTGLDVIRAARDDVRLRSLPVVVVTSSDDRDLLRGALDAGADDYLVKPFDAAELVARIGARLRQQREWSRLSAIRGLQQSQLRRMLDRASRARSLTEAAREICSLASEVEGVSGAAVITMSFGAVAEVVASKGLPTLNSGSRLDCAVAECLREKASTGPWIEPADSQPACAAHIPEGFAAAPLGSTRPRGVVVLGLATDTPRNTGDVLAFAIDVAAIAGPTLDRYLDESDERAIGRASVQQLLARRQYAVVFQPIVDLASGETVGLEALTRFEDGTRPDLRFRQAAVLGLGAELELDVIDTAIQQADALSPDCFLSVNVSPSTLVEHTADVQRVVDNRPDAVLEVSEQEPVEDYLALRKRVEELPSTIRLSVDDAGSGFASLRHILQLEPAFVKLDRSWVQGVDVDPARQALIAGLRHFSRAAGATLVAEGVETPAERDELRNLEVDMAQGFLFGRPAASGARA